MAAPPDPRGHDLVSSSGDHVQPRVNPLPMLPEDSIYTAQRGMGVDNGCWRLSHEHIEWAFEPDAALEDSSPLSLPWLSGCS